VTIGNVMQAALYVLTTVTSVSALAIALFGSAAALERWLDGPQKEPTRTPAAKIARDPDPSAFEPAAHTQVA
jgi:hypothetical protein